MFWTWRNIYDSRIFLAPDGAPEGGTAPAPDAGAGADPQGADEGNEQETNDLTAEVTRLRAEMARQKAAMDKALSETNSYKKQLRAKQTAEEVAAEEAKAAEEARNNELNELRKKFQVMEITKNVAVELGCGEDSSNKIAEFINGAEDPNAVISEFKKILAAQEKKLRLEFGRVPPPGAGAANGGESEAVKRARELGKAKSEAAKTAQDALAAYMR